MAEIGTRRIPLIEFNKIGSDIETQLYPYLLTDMETSDKVNLRKEFFNVPIEKIKEALAKLEVPNARFTLFAQAEEYRETLNIEKQKK